MLKIGKAILIIISLILNISFSIPYHECIYDKVKIPREYMTNEMTGQNQRRHLVGNGNPIRITYNTQYLNNMTNTTTKQLILDVVQVAIYAIREYIYVTPETQPLVAGANFPCTSVSPSGLSGGTDTSTGVTSSDLHLYITWTSEPTQSFLAWATACQLRLDRPIFGQVNYNVAFLAQLSNANYDFYDLLQTSVHEITHVLGFGKSDVAKFHTTYGGSAYASVSTILSQQTIRGLSTNVLSSPAVLALTKSHFNCPSATGMQLENSGGSGSKDDHWERTVIQNEIMTAQALHSISQTTKFTLAFLADTNWYSFINMSMGETTPWGRNRGCSFLTSPCNQTTYYYPEFPQTSGKMCDFLGTAQGLATTDIFMDSGCNYVVGYSNSDCQRSPAPSYGNYTGETYQSFNCKCFNSTLTGAGISGLQSLLSRCYTYTCTNQGVVVKVGTSNYLCSFSGQILAAQTGFQGYLQCPLQLTEFCSLPLNCPNFCSKKGICRQSVCHCMTGYAGDDCSVTCSTVVSTAAVCVASCPSGQYANEFSRQCQVCNQACTVCTGSRYIDCTTCATGYTLSSAGCLCNSPNFIMPDGQCIAACPNRFYNSNSTKCDLCDVTCEACNVTATQCTSCPGGRALQSGICSIAGAYNYNTISCPSDKKLDKTTFLCVDYSSIIQASFILVLALNILSFII